MIARDIQALHASRVMQNALGNFRLHSTEAGLKMRPQWPCGGQGSRMAGCCYSECLPGVRVVIIIREELLIVTLGSVRIWRDQKMGGQGSSGTRG